MNPSHMIWKGNDGTFQHQDGLPFVVVFDSKDDKDKKLTWKTPVSTSSRQEYKLCKLLLRYELHII